MIKVETNKSLKEYNTFGIEVHARYFAVFRQVDVLRKLVSEMNQQPLVVLGGGSNVLFLKDIDGLVLKNEIAGIEKVKEDGDEVYIKVGAGVNWHRFVLYCLENNWAGVENLALIPGSVGASPMQNIGAYGVEIKDVFHELEAFHIKEQHLETFGKNDCAFGYRESIFKGKYKGEFIITSVTYRLQKKPSFQVSYGAIRQELEKMNVAMSIQAIAQAVIRIRSSKLPDPTIIGNAGSFFKNPSVTTALYGELNKQYPAMPAYPSVDGTVKLAAGWLIEQCGWKGFRRGDAGCYDKQALVLVNYGKASGSDIFQLSEDILQSVRQRFGIELEREVNVVT